MIDRAQVGPELRSRVLRLPSISLPFVLLVAPILLLGFALSVCRRGGAELGLDEALSYFIASKTPLEIIKYSASHIYEHPPGYYLLLHLWMAAAGSSEFALRLLSAMGDLLAVTLVATLARRWFGAHIALLAALLMALQPLAAGFGNTARMYSWLIALSVLQVYLFVLAVERNRWRDWALFLATMGLAISLHYLAAFAVLVYAFFLALRWRNLRACRLRLLAVLLVLIGLPALWVALSPGLRQTLLDVAYQLLNGTKRLDGLAAIYTEWALGSSLEDVPRLLTLVMAAIPWLLCVAGIAGMAQPKTWQRRDLQVLLALLVFLPPLAGSWLFSAVIFEPAGPARHHSAMLGMFALCAALGVDAVFRYRRTLGVAALATVAVLDVWLLAGIVGQGSWRPFSQAMAYVSERAQGEDKLAFSYFFDWVQASYYNTQKLPIVFIPSEDKPLNTNEARERAAAALDKGPALWLVLYPTATHSAEIIERAFNEVAFPANKTWFPGSRAVVQYFGAQPMEQHQAQMSWEPGIRLMSWASSSSKVRAGDAIRLLFQWQRSQTLQDRAVLSLALYGPDGQAWAARASEPCNGWCSTTEWPAGPVADRQALYIPTDVPPGDYDLRVSWLTADGAPISGRASDAEPLQRELSLMPVHVDRPASPASPSAAEGKRLDGEFRPGLELYAAKLPPSPALGGSHLVVPTQWRVSAALPALTARLHLAQGGQDVALDSPLGPDWYPSQAWDPDRSVRAQPRFSLPGTLSGKYQASLGLVGPDGKELPARVPLGILTVADRPHRFDMSQQGAPVDIDWEEGIRLARVEASTAAAPGGQLPVTLIWRADRPTGGNWKVFVHLVKTDGGTVAQDDAYPMGGQAPTPTWQHDEVITDPHVINLPAALQPGTYQLQVGLYDEKTGSRLPLKAGGDNLILPAQVTVAP